jgi:hypothetical protein
MSSSPTKSSIQYTDHGVHRHKNWSPPPSLSSRWGSNSKKWCTRHFSSLPPCPIEYAPYPQTSPSISCNTGPIPSNFGFCTPLISHHGFLCQFWAFMMYLLAGTRCVLHPSHRSIVSNIPVASGCIPCPSLWCRQQCHVKLQCRSSLSSSSTNPSPYPLSPFQLTNDSSPCLHIAYSVPSHWIDDNPAWNCSVVRRFCHLAPPLFPIIHIPLHLL